MPVLDGYHGHVVDALCTDGWTITAENRAYSVGQRTIYIDIEAERTIDNETIAVEVKVLGGRSIVADLERSLGQYLFYLEVLSQRAPDRVLWLAVPFDHCVTTFRETLMSRLVVRYAIRLLVFDPATRSIVTWQTP